VPNNKFIFKSLTIKYGFFSKTFQFSEKNNLIYSVRNSVGKSSLLRLLIYSLGYKIPSTKGLKFKQLELELNAECPVGNITLIREDKYFNLKNNSINEKEIYSLPSDLDKILSYIYHIDNINTINNILGSFYLDQERGWTLLNRGKVSGNIRFNIESLIRGLANIDCQELISELKDIKREIQKYKHMENVSEYQREINKDRKYLVYNDYETGLKNEIDFLLSQKEELRNELRELDSVIKDNKTFKKYIEKYKLRVQNNDGIKIDVNENTILNMSDNKQSLITKKKIVSNKLSSLNNKIKELEKSLSKDNLLGDTKTLIDSFDKDISNIKVNQREVKKALESLESKRKEIEIEIEKKTKSNKDIINDMYNIILKYSSELGLDEKYINNTMDFIFTSDLKSLSGAILHKIVFSFKMAYIKMIKDRTNLILPIILDSPNGRETKKENVDSMIKIITRDYSEHQLIMASIFDKYDIDDLTKIEIKDTLLE